jgi:hypothetical protein
MTPKDARCAYCCGNPNSFPRDLRMCCVSTEVCQAYNQKLELEKIQVVLDQNCIGVDSIHMSVKGTITINVSSTFADYDIK